MKKEKNKKEKRTTRRMRSEVFVLFAQTGEIDPMDVKYTGPAIRRRFVGDSLRRNLDVTTMSLPREGLIRAE